MGDRIKLTSSDGFTFNAYRTTPAGKPKGAVVVIQEVWGLNNFVRAEVDRYATEGYVAIAPALFDRVELGYESQDYGPTGFAHIGELMQNFSHDTARLDVEAAVKAVADVGKVGITGYCFGGATAWRAAHFGLGLAAASGYYGGGVPSYIGLAPTMPLEMHYGDNDKGIPLEQINELRAAHPDLPIYVYPAGHGFCNFERPENYNAEAAKLANQRTLAFFAKHLA
ncbi:dienelactone hydrolase family protein [Devosia sp.]|uniref:dienelactone hydrolase family protein n=1 Tax=Devosia sp. TaxID=1871048 RepID=UPI003263DF77